MKELQAGKMADATVLAYLRDKDVLKIIQSDMIDLPRREMRVAILHFLLDCLKCGGNEAREIFAD